MIKSHQWFRAQTQTVSYSAGTSEANLDQDPNWESGFFLYKTKPVLQPPKNWMPLAMEAVPQTGKSHTYFWKMQYPLKQLLLAIVEDKLLD